MLHDYLLGLGWVASLILGLYLGIRNKQERSSNLRWSDMIDKYVSIAAHQLRSPPRTIQGLASAPRCFTNFK